MRSATYAIEKSSLQAEQGITWLHIIKGMIIAIYL